MQRHDGEEVAGEYRRIWSFSRRGEGLYNPGKMPVFRYLYRGTKIAVAHSILVAAFHILDRGVPYEDLGADWFIRPESQERHARKLVKQLNALGYAVELSPGRLPSANPVFSPQLAAESSLQTGRGEDGVCFTPRLWNTAVGRVTLTGQGSEHIDNLGSLI